jgi:hypothetical protein
MTINTDYAQYRDWGLMPKEPEKPKEEPKKDDTIKSNVTSPKWLKNGRSRAKL